MAKQLPIRSTGQIQICYRIKLLPSMRQGLPQGSVLSPLLFILYVNDLAESLPEDGAAAIFADDVTLMATHRKKEQAESDLQSLVDIVATWSKQWRLSLNADKCVTWFFSTDSK